MYSVTWNSGVAIDRDYDIETGYSEFKLLSQAIAFVHELRADHGDPGYPLDVSVVKIPENVETNARGNFVVTLPVSKFEIEIKRMTGKDEQEMLDKVRKQNKRNNGVDSSLSEQLKTIMVSVNGDDRRTTCNYFAENMLSADTRFLREAYRNIIPDVKLNFDFECRACGHEQELEVALDADFFWPD